LAPDLAVFGAGDIEVGLGACYADEEEPAFLFGFVAIVDAALVGQEAFFNANDKDVIEFEAFGGMQGHYCDAFGSSVVSVSIAEERDLLEIIDQ
jgi:hypothetical protein